MFIDTSTPELPGAINSAHIVWWRWAYKGSPDDPQPGIWVQFALAGREPFWFEGEVAERIKRDLQTLTLGRAEPWHADYQPTNQWSYSRINLTDDPIERARNALARLAAGD